MKNTQPVPKLLFLLTLVCLSGARLPLLAQAGEQTLPAGVTLSHFAQIDKEVFVGSKPHSDRDFEFLQSHHIRYIVNARFLPFFSAIEKKKAKRYGMTLIPKPMNASPIAPRREHVDDILLTLHDKAYQPVYLHCVLGRDRTSLISGLYKIYFLHAPKAEVYGEMKESGFRTSWFVHGLKVYFDRHADQAPQRP